MKNPEQGSFTEMVEQNAHKFPVIDTIHPPLTLRQAERAAKFLAMFTPQAAPGVDAGAVPVAAPDVDKAQEQTAPRCKSYEEISAERAERRAKSKAHHRQPKRKPNTWQSYKAPAAPEAQESQEQRPAWLLDALECLNEPIMTEQTPPKKQIRRQVQLKPISPLADLLDLETLRPKRGRGYGTMGAGALAELLDRCARIALAYRLYLYDEDGNPPPQIVLHLCAELLAAILRISENTLRDWTAQLTKDGYLYARAHKTTATLEGEQVTVVDGMLYAVRLAPGHEARLRYEDYKKQYRNLDADRAAGRTAYNAIRNAERRAEVYAEEQREAQNLNAVLNGEKNTEGSLNLTGRIQAELREQLQRWAVIPGNITTENPLNADPAVFSPEEVAARLNGVQDVVYLLPTLTAAHASKRAALVGIIAATIARDLGDTKSRNYFCKIIWEAWQEELEGQNGLQHLAAQLQRLEVDRREWKELRNPAALLAARLRAA